MSEWRRGCNVENRSNRDGRDDRDGKRVERYDNRNRDDNNRNNRNRNNRNRDDNRNNRNRDDNRNNYNNRNNRNRDDNRNNYNNRNNRNRDEYREYNYHMENRNNQVPNNFVPLVVAEEKPVVEYKPDDSRYANIVRGTETVDVEEARVNVNDPKHWRGSIWVGPRMVRMRKSNSNMTNNNFALKGDGYVTPGTVVISTPYPYEHSRDGVNWYKSFKETFTEEQLEAIREQEEQEMYNKWCERSNEIYEKRRMESLQHYYETGEEDSFMIAERESREYDEYLERFEKQFEEYEEEEEEECYDSETSEKSY